MVNLIRVYFDAQKHYARQPPEVKAICRGLKRPVLIRRAAQELRRHLETMHSGDSG